MLLRRYDSLSDRIVSADGLASANNDVFNMHEPATVEIHAQLRDQMERMNGHESSADMLNAQIQNNSDLHVVNMDRIRNEASAEFGRICRLADALHRRVGGNSDEADQRLSVLAQRQMSPATRHVSPVQPGGRFLLADTPSPHQARELAAWSFARDERVERRGDPSRDRGGWPNVAPYAIRA